MRSLLSLLPLSLLAASFLNESVGAQTGIILNSGCPNAVPPAVSGAPRLGTRMQFGWGCAATDLPLLWFGPTTPLTPISPPLACVRGICNLAVQPVVVFVTGVGQQIQLTVQVPQDRSLIRRILGVQAACIDPARSCLRLSAGLALRFFP